VSASPKRLSNVIGHISERHKYIYFVLIYNWIMKQHISCFRHGVSLYQTLLFSCHPWIGEYYEHNERGEYKPNITIRNNTGSNISYLYEYICNITEYKTKCCQRVLKIYTNKKTAVKQHNQTKTPCIGPCVVCPLGARKPNTKMPEMILLTSWQTTQGPDYPDRSGDGKHGPENFRNNKNETKFWRPPQMRSNQ
jgi:hypothetical protein